MLFDSRDRGLVDDPKRACVAALRVPDVCLGVESRTLKNVGTGCNVSVRI
jgi:hypothetical protein